MAARRRGSDVVIRRATVMVTAVWMLLAMAAGGAMFMLKYRVQALEERLATVNHDIVRNMEAIHVLKAEWSFLNQPARLEELGRRYLELDAPAAGRIVAISEIPFRTAPDAAPQTDAPAPRGMDKPPQAADQVTPRLATYRTAQ
jgi:hypothetical protein